MIISPSILSADFMNLQQEIEDVQNAGAEWIHVDVMDGHFVPNITVGIPVIKSIREKSDVFLDVHLMIENPEKYIEVFVKSGADLITFHYEACKNNKKVVEIIDLIHSFGKKAGISIKPETSADTIFPFLSIVDLVLIMTVEPGFGGQKFISDCIPKISKAKINAPKKLILQVDGGINFETAKICIKAGATSLVAGSYIFNNADYKNAIGNLLNIPYKK